MQPVWHQIRKSDYGRLPPQIVVKRRLSSQYSSMAVFKDILLSDIFNGYCDVVRIKSKCIFYHRTIFLCPVFEHCLTLKNLIWLPCEFLKKTFRLINCYDLVSDEALYHTKCCSNFTSMKQNKSTNNKKSRRPVHTSMLAVLRQFVNDLNLFMEQ